jgi:hypothetical protein
MSLALLIGAYVRQNIMVVENMTEASHLLAARKQRGCACMRWAFSLSFSSI